MDPVQAELVRARQLLDRTNEINMDTYKALDAIWQTLYYMLMEASGVLGPQPKGKDIVQEKVGEVLKELVQDKKKAKDGQYL